MKKTSAPQPRRRGRPATITREAIEQAVIEVGLDRASTTTVAAHLGVDQSSLYRHIDSKQAMISGAVDRLRDTLDWDQEVDSWEDYVRLIADSLWTLFRAHPGLCAEMYKLANSISDASRRLTSEAVGRMVSFGWSVPDAVLVLDTVSDMTADYVFTLEERVDRVELRRLMQTSRRPDDALEREIYDYFGSVLEADPRHWWERKLELVIAGATRLYAGGAGA